MKTIELKPTNGRKSFGKKAFINQDGMVSKLLSYGAEIAQYNA